MSVVTRLREFMRDDEADGSSEDWYIPIYPADARLLLANLDAQKPFAEWSGRIGDGVYNRETQIGDWKEPPTLTQLRTLAATRKALEGTYDRTEISGRRSKEP